MIDRTNAGERAFAAAPAVGPEAMDFVRFCHRRRRVGWPELYDEMCAVSGRGLYRGYGAEELSSIGIGFGLFEMPALAGLVARVVAEDVERRQRSAAALMAGLAAQDANVATINVADGDTTHVAASGTHSNEPEPANPGAPEHRALRVAVGAGA